MVRKTAVAGEPMGMLVNAQERPLELARLVQLRMCGRSDRLLTLSGHGSDPALRQGIQASFGISCTPASQLTIVLRDLPNPIGHLRLRHACGFANAAEFFGGHLLTLLSRLLNGTY